jgi:hypothetical protein
MKYLKEYSEHNSTPLYKEINSEEYNALLTVKTYDFSQEEIDSINNIPSIKDKFKFEVYRNKKSRFENRPQAILLLANLDIGYIHADNKHYYNNVEIKKINDEWYYVLFRYYEDNNAIYTWYKCDQLDGLKECLTHLIEINNQEKLSPEEIQSAFKYNKDKLNY